MFVVIYIFVLFNMAHSTEVRGYSFGDSYNSILNTEASKNQYRLMPSLTNQNRLVYSGSMLNRDVDLIFHFRNSRLSSITYLWRNASNETLLYHQVNNMLKSKYASFQTHDSNNSYIQYSTNITTANHKSTTNITPLLYINLEKLTLSNTIHNVILEYQAFDSDKFIKEKILSEDI